MKHVVIARTYMGGKDLYMGVPNLDGAILERTETEKTVDDYTTILVFRLKSGDEFVLQVRQGR